MSWYCDVAPGHPVHGPYHDNEYGFPLEDEAALLERLSLEIFQAGLSWLIVLKKRPSTVAAFDGFDVDSVAGYGAGVESVLSLPLEAGGRVIGTLSLLGKVAADALATEHFGKDDETTLTRFAEHAQHALAQRRHSGLLELRRAYRRHGHRTLAAS